MDKVEDAIMKTHFGYLGKIIKENTVVAYGLVMDPKGTCGIAVFKAEDNAIAQTIAKKDPAVKLVADFSFKMRQSLMYHAPLEIGIQLTSYFNIIHCRPVHKKKYFGGDFFGD